MRLPVGGGNGDGRNSNREGVILGVIEMRFDKVGKIERDISEREKKCWEI